MAKGKRKNNKGNMDFEQSTKKNSESKDQNQNQTTNERSK